jgi:hypothetical protein
VIEVRLDDVDRLGLEDRLELLEADKALPGGAIGQPARSAMIRTASVSPGWTGSSQNIGANGASSSMYWSAADIDAGRPWKSIMMSTFGPTASRSTCIRRPTCWREGRSTR